MVDFLITHVRYNEDKTHITHVKVRELIVKEGGNTTGVARTVDRGFIADLIRLEKVTFQTAVKKDNGNLALGANVHLYDKVYLSTDQNSIDRDNLGNLPEF